MWICSVNVVYTVHRTLQQIHITMFKSVSVNENEYESSSFFSLTRNIKWSGDKLMWPIKTDETKNETQTYYRNLKCTQTQIVRTHTHTHSGVHAQQKLMLPAQWDDASWWWLFSHCLRKNSKMKVHMVHEWIGALVWKFRYWRGSPGTANVFICID